VDTSENASAAIETPAHVDADFAALLGPRFRLEDLDQEPASVFGLWPDGTIAYTNPAWRAFASANEGQPAVEREWGLGARYLDAITDALRPFYEDLLARAPDAGTSLHPAFHQYECSSATVFRRFGMQVYALDGRAGFIIVNSLLVEAPHDDAVRPPHAADPASYVNARGIIVQCSHCRRVQHAVHPTRWDWVPGWVDRSPAATSHGICPVCFEYYYPDDGA
jgi:hypothetical protein